MNNNRTVNIIRNSVSGMLGQLIITLTAFAYRTVFIYSLGQTYLGLQGLFTNILLLLSLAELGISSAVNFSLYKPLAEKDTKKIKGLLNYYKRTYQIIAVVIAFFGLLLLPFLDFFIDTRPEIPESLELIYMLYLSNSIISYMFVHKQTLIIADQKGYIITIYKNTFLLIRDLMLIGWLLLFELFLPTLVVYSIITLISNYVLSRKADKMYPYLKYKNKERLDNETRKEITLKIKSMFLYKIGAFVVNGTDNILISKFIGIVWVGIYSNYLVLISSVKVLIQYLITSLTPSVGNILALSDKKKIFSVYNTLYFVVFWVFSFFTSSFLALLNPFVSIWIGEEYLLNEWLVVTIVLNFYLYGIHQHMLIYRNALGLYQYAKYKPIVEALVNLTASIYLLKEFGLIGVLLGTTISYVSTGLWIEPYVLYRHYLHTGLKDYWFKYIVYLMVTILTSFIMYFLSISIFSGTILSFIILLLTCLFVPNCLMIIIFRRTTEYLDVKSRIIQLTKSLRGFI